MLETADIATRSASAAASLADGSPCQDASEDENGLLAEAAPSDAAGTSPCAGAGASLYIVRGLLKKAAHVAPTLATSFLLCGINVVQAVLLAHALGPTGRGELATALSYSRLLTYIGLFGTTYVIARRVARAASSSAATVPAKAPERRPVSSWPTRHPQADRDRANMAPGSAPARAGGSPQESGQSPSAAISRSAVRSGLATGLVTMCIVAVLSLVALPADKQSLAWLSIICATMLPLEHMRLNLNAVDQGSGRMGRFNAGRIVASLAYPLLLAGAWLSGGITARLAALLIVPATMTGLAFRLLWSDDRRPWRSGSPSVGRILQEGRPYAFSVVVMEVFNNLDWLLILWLVDYTQQGLYAAALPAVRLLCVAPEAVAVFTFNAGARQSRPLAKGRLCAMAAGTLLVQALAAAAYWTVLGHLILLVYREKFAGAIPFANALLPAMVFQGGTIIADGYLRGRGKAGVGIKARLAGALCMAAAALFLYGRYGALAIPWAASVGSGVAALCLATAILRETADRKTGSAAAASSAACDAGEESEQLCDCAKLNHLTTGEE